MQARTYVIAALLAAAAPFASAGQQPLDNPDAPIVAEFNRRVADYISLHKTLEGTVPTLRVSADTAEIGRAVEALGVAIRRARPHAHAGDIFFPEAAAMFRRTIRERYGTQYESLIAMVHQETPPLPRAVVNGAWPGSGHTLMPPDLLRRFPLLSEGLEYRFVNRDLVLWDSHANVIVDVLRDAIPANT